MHMPSGELAPLCKNLALLNATILLVLGLSLGRLESSSYDRS